MLSSSCPSLNGALITLPMKQYMGEYNFSRILCVCNNLHIFFTVGSLNADILRYNADIFSTTLKLLRQTGWKCELSQHFSISFSYISSFYPIKLSLSSAQYVSACGSTVAFRAHDVISRERLPQMCDNTDTVRSAPIFRNFPNSAGLDNVLEIFCTIHYLFPFNV